MFTIFAKGKHIPKNIKITLAINTNPSIVIIKYTYKGYTGLHDDVMSLCSG